MAICWNDQSSASRVGDVSSLWYPAVGHVFAKVVPVCREDTNPIPGDRSVVKYDTIIPTQCFLSFFEILIGPLVKLNVFLHFNKNP